MGDRICDFLRDNDSREATGRSLLGFCDGRKVWVYVGETRGRVSHQKRGEYGFSWDSIFVPEGSEQTYAEMGLLKKGETSPSFRAWDAFLRERVWDEKARQRIKGQSNTRSSPAPT